MSSLKVSDVMSRDVSVCRPSDSLDAAARAMWESDCGIVPVVDATGGLVGVLTDRDLCMAGYIGGERLASIPVVRVMAREVVTIGPDEALASAQALLRERALHRLPVVDEERRLVGMLSLADLVLAAAAEPKAALRRRAAEALLETLVAVKAPRRAPEPEKTIEPQPAASARRRSSTRRAAPPASAPAKQASAAKPKAGTRRKKPATR